MKTIPISTGRPYDVHIGEKILQYTGKRIAAISGVGYQKIALVCDDHVAPLYADTVAQSLRSAGYQVFLFTYPHGEHSKNSSVLFELITFLATNQITRTDVIIALGGGVTGDLAGFAAAIYHRGIDYIQIPTTLLAMVDSSVGGKTAVNLPAGKNLVGAFWQPRLVICDLSTLATLPDGIFTDGMAEVAKYGCIRDSGLFSLLEGGDVKNNLPKVVSSCVAIKAEIVAQDERDKGLRNILNFGHTVGHGIEKLSGYEISHGRAVAIGMCLAAAAGEAAGHTPKGTAKRIEALLKQYGLSTACPYPTKALAEACLGDKKRSGETISFILLSKIGQALVHPVSAPGLQRFLEGKKP